MRHNTRANLRRERNYHSHFRCTVLGYTGKDGIIWSTDMHEDTSRGLILQPAAPVGEMAPLVFARYIKRTTMTPREDERLQDTFLIHVCDPGVQHRFCNMVQRQTKKDVFIGS